VVDITTDRRAFRALVRSRVFRWVQYAATGQWEAWSDDLTEIGNHGWTAAKLIEQFEPYFEAYADTPRNEAIGIDGDARGPARFAVAEVGPSGASERGTGEDWSIEQILADPEGHDEWYLEVTVDLPASADYGEIVARLEGLRRR
jgi:hypothetical protein